MALHESTAGEGQTRTNIDRDVESGGLSSQQYGGVASPSASPAPSGRASVVTDLPEENAERHALLYTGRRSPSCCERCLFSLSTVELWEILFMLFLIHLIVTDHWNAWMHLVRVMLEADVVYAFLVVASVLLTTVSLLNLKWGAADATFICELSWVFLVATFGWYAILKISEIHDLRVWCWRCIDKEQSMNLDGLRSFLSCWRWIPVGFLDCFAGVWWRPWWFFLYALPQALVGTGPLWKDGLSWAHKREILIGSVWQPCCEVILLMGAQIGEEDWRLVLLLSFVLSLCVSAVPFYFTSAPFMEFWGFLLHPWQNLIDILGNGHGASLQVEEIFALGVMIWGICRFLFVVASTRVEAWNARKRMEQGLRYALEHPFRAQLEQNFGETVFGDIEQGQGVVQRTLSHIAGGAVETTLESTVSLKEKRKTLQELSRDWQCSAAALPSRLVLQVRRADLLEDTFKALSQKPVSELLAPSMVVRYEDELGADAGGLTRDWFDSVARLLAEGSGDSSGSSLLATAADQTLVPRPLWQDTGDVPKEEQDKFRSLLALGRFLALAVYRDQPLPLSFSLVACKHLLRVPVGSADVQSIDPEFYRCRVLAVLKEGGLQEIEAALGEPLVFMSASTEFLPEPIELKEDGENIVVTEENKLEYVQLLCEAYLCGGIRREIQCMLQGFWDLLPRELLMKIEVSPRELSLLISGTRTLDPSDWRKHCVYRLPTQPEKGTMVLSWFWELVSEFDDEQRCMLLHFATGTSRLPPAGFADLQPQFTVCVLEGGLSDRLPVAHTCCNQLDLQEYETKDQLRGKLKMAIYTETFQLV